MANYLRLGRLALFAAVVGLSGCSHQLPKLDVQAIDDALDAFRAQPICPLKSGRTV